MLNYLQWGHDANAWSAPMVRPSKRRRLALRVHSVGHQDFRDHAGLDGDKTGVGSNLQPVLSARPRSRREARRP